MKKSDFLQFCQMREAELRNIKFNRRRWGCSFTGGMYSVAVRGEWVMHQEQIQLNEYDLQYNEHFIQASSNFIRVKMFLIQIRYSRKKFRISDIQ